MTPRYDAAGVFKARENVMLAELLDRPPAHPTAVGDHAELHWRRMLREFLPSRYCIGSGFAISLDGDCSDQLDIVIYDEQYTPTLRAGQDGAVQVLAAESVYAVFEVKPELSKQTVEYAAEKLASVRRLNRTSTSIRSNVGTTAGEAPKPIIGGLLALDTSWTPGFGTAFSTSVGDQAGGPGRLDIGCALRAGAWVTPFEQGWETTRICEQDGTLVFFATSLFDLLRRLGTVTAIDIEAWQRAAGVATRAPS